jgi:heptosyltransferase-1
LTLVDCAAMLAGARAVVGVDTGLLHLAAALDVPTVGLFGATPRWRYAPYWSPRSISLGSFGEMGAQPGPDAVVQGLRRLDVLSDA